MSTPAAYTPAQAAAMHRTERACAHLLGMIRGITADGYLHDSEILFLRTWLASERDALAHWMGRSIAQHLDQVLADGHVSDEERAWLLDALSQAAGQTFTETGSVSPEVSGGIPFDDGVPVFAGKVFCLTGKFAYGARAKCTAVTLAAGGTCTDKVSRGTDYLVIGSAGPTTSWKQASYGQKIDDAMRLKAKGAGILILPESAWCAALPG